MTTYKKNWVDTYQIHSYEADVSARATVSSILQFMQESAWHHAENLGVGFSQLFKDGLIWVLSQQLIHIEQFPKWGETVTVQTWPSGRDRLAYIRDFKMLNQNENHNLLLIFLQGSFFLLIFQL